MIVTPACRARTSPPEEDSVTLRLLGPVEMADRGRVLEVGPPQRKTVLAALAVDAGAPVPVELLVDRVWCGDPPVGARAALHAHITRLRGVLAQSRTAPALLGRRNLGYVLEIDRDRVDLHRFQRLVAQSREPGCDDDRRVRLLREVLSIWRGPPLTSVPGDWADRVRSGIEPQLIGAAVGWAQAELRLGHAEAAIDKLAYLTARHPLSEPLSASLMRALCAVGRRAEALQHYASTRSHLREVLGTEPGPDLSSLHTAILRGELAPADRDRPEEPTPLPRPAGPRPAGPRPRQLPIGTATFTGRQRELATVAEACGSGRSESSPPLVVIHGCGGVGKSALAIRAARQLAGQYPDGQIYADLRGHRPGTPPLRPLQVLHRLLRTLGVPAAGCPDDVEETAALFRTLTADRRLLLLLDNAQNSGQVCRLSPADPGCGVLVTSRRVLAGLAGAHHVQLGVLSGPEATELLCRTVGAARVAAEPEAAAEIAGWCGYLPLALCAAAARLVARPGWTVAALAQRLADERSRLDELDLAELSIRRCLAGSYQELAGSAAPADRRAAVAFAQLGCWDRPQLSGLDATRLLGLPGGEVEPLLERLADAQLLESLAPGRYLLPQLLRLYAREQAGPAGRER